MICNKTVKKRVFSLDKISEEEGIVLRSLLNLSELGVREKLNEDKDYWNEDLGEDDAVKIGRSLCQSIMDLVDKA